MSVGSSAADLGGEREIDLRRWLDAVLRQRWFVVAGVVLGIVVGVLFSLSGAGGYAATVTIQPAQPFNPEGNPVLNYTSSPLAIELLVTSGDALNHAASAAHMPESQLIGAVTTASISTSAGPVAQRGTVLIEVTVTLPNAKRATLAANALGAYVLRETEGPYVRQSLKIYAQRNQTWTARLNAVTSAINQYDSVLATTKLDPFDKLVLVSQLDAAISRQGALEDELIANQTQVVLAKNIELAQIINPAASQKVTARSRRDSILFGAVIGLLIGLLVALVVGLRTQRPAAAK